MLQALGLGCSSAASVGVLLRQLQRRGPQRAPVEQLGALERYGKQQASPLSVYDALLGSQQGVLA